MELWLWLCTESCRADCIPLPVWVGRERCAVRMCTFADLIRFLLIYPSLDRRWCSGRRLELRAARSSHDHVYTRPAAWAVHRSNLRSMDSGEIQLALGGRSFTFTFSRTSLNECCSSGPQASLVSLCKRLDCSISKKVRLSPSMIAYESHRIISVAYAPVLLERKAKHIREGREDSEKGPAQEVRTIFDSPDREYVFLPPT